MIYQIVDLTNVDAIMAFLDKYTPRTSEKVEALPEAELVRRWVAGLPLGIKTANEPKKSKHVG